MPESGYTELSHLRVAGSFNDSVSELKRDGLQPGQKVTVLAGKWHPKYGISVVVRAEGTPQMPSVNLGRVNLDPEDRAMIETILKPALVDMSWTGARSAVRS
jgi:hypothetical protein